MPGNVSHHVVTDPDGGWVVIKGGSGRASKHFDNKQQAIEWGFEVSKHQKSEFYIHGRDGKVQKMGLSGFPNEFFEKILLLKNYPNTPGLSPA